MIPEVLPKWRSPKGAILEETTILTSILFSATPFLPEGYKNILVSVRSLWHCFCGMFEQKK